MVFSEKLMELRRREGISQEQLADRLGVTRQSVSKWESGTAMPELAKLIALSDLFGVSVDYLVKDRMEMPEHVGTSADSARLEQRVKDLEGEYHRSFGSYYSYTSEKKLFGLPLLAIRFGRDRRPNRNNCAVGVIAIGNFAVGGISIGMISVGLLSFGMVTFGGAAFGMVAMGLLARGISVIGLSAKGIAAVKLSEYFK